MTVSKKDLLPDSPDSELAIPHRLLLSAFSLLGGAAPRSLEGYARSQIRSALVMLLPGYMVDMMGKSGIRANADCIYLAGPSAPWKEVLKDKTFFPSDRPIPQFLDVGAVEDQYDATSWMEYSHLAITHSNIVVACYTPHTSWAGVAMELEFAASLAKPCVIIVREGTQESLPFQPEELECLEMPHPWFEQASFIWCKDEGSAGDIVGRLLQRS